MILHVLLIVLDAFMLWGIARLVVGRDVSEYRLHFAILACVVFAIWFLLHGMNIYLLLAIDFAVVATGMGLIVGMPIRKAAIGAALFTAYRFVIGLLLTVGMTPT